MVICFVVIYCVLNVILIVLLCCCGMNLFDVFCYVFGILVIGGFSIYNGSIGYFDSVIIDYLIMFFMVLVGINFILFYFVFIGVYKCFLVDIEWWIYIVLIGIFMLVIVSVGYVVNYFSFDGLFSLFCYGFFQVVLIIIIMGYGMDDYD